MEDGPMKLRYSVLLWLFLLLVPVTLYSAVSDTLYLQGGDRITADVKSLSNNQLRISTNDAGAIRIEWNKIDSVAILNTMRVVLADGRIFYGRILPCGVEQAGEIWSYNREPVFVLFRQVVMLSPIEEAFINRLNGTLSTGVNYTKASKVLQMHFSGMVTYLAQKNQFDLEYSGIFTREGDSDNSQNQNGGITFRRHLPKKWFLIGQLSAESNSELQLDLRTSAGFGGGNNILLTNSMNLYAAAGLLFGREESVDLEQYNIEGKIVADYTVFIYDTPELSFSFNGSLIPSLNDFGRIRSEIRSSLKWEVLNDLFLKWSFYYIFDSRPLSGSRDERSDWGISMLGVEYDL